jgi:hypothetical protein
MPRKRSTNSKRAVARMQEAGPEAVVGELEGADVVNGGGESLDQSKEAKNEKKKAKKDKKEKTKIDASVPVNETSVAAERDSKKKRLMLSDDEDDDDDDKDEELTLTINEAYKKRFDHNKEREELQRCK